MSYDATTSDAAPLLQGVRVLEVASFFSGPHCGMLLADMGADVIKIEHPDGGDPTRNREDDSGYAASFAAKNRSKRGIALDLRTPRGQEVMRRLVASSDVLVTNVRPQSRRRLGIDWADLRPVNPGLIYCAIGGEGESGPAGERPSFDTTAQARSGVLRMVTDQTDAPMTVKVLLADLMSGYYATYGILGALYRRARTGQGSVVSTSLLRGSLAFGDSAFFYIFEAMARGRTRTGLTMRTAGFLFTAGDGKAFAVHLPPSPPRYWVDLLEILGRPELAEDPRFATKEMREANYPVLHAELSRAAKRHARAYWQTALEARDIPYAPINEPAEVFDDELVKGLDMLHETTSPTGRTLRYVGSGVTVSGGGIVPPRPAPLLGEHTAEILAELGLPEESSGDVSQGGLD